MRTRCFQFVAAEVTAQTENKNRLEPSDAGCYGFCARASARFNVRSGATRDMPGLPALWELKRRERRAPRRAGNDGTRGPTRSASHTGAKVIVTCHSLRCSSARPLFDSLLLDGYACIVGIFDSLLLDRNACIIGVFGPLVLGRNARTTGSSTGSTQDIPKNVLRSVMPTHAR